MLLWNICQEEVLVWRFSCYAKQIPLLEQIADRYGCTLECLSQRGLRKHLRKCFLRPCLSLGLLAVLLCSFLFTGRIWIIEISPCEGVDEDRISHCLWDMGVHIGSVGRTLDEQELKFALLQQIPELSWVAVNRDGGKLSVLTLERQVRNETHFPEASHLIACRDGVVTELAVLEGTELCKVGDAVRKDQVLVSGIEDQGIYLRAVQSDGEIYGQTWHRGMLILPVKIRQKHYTGVDYSHLSMIFGRKRINFSINSSISGVLCDKMVETKQLSLFGYDFPVYFEREICREYVLTEVSLGQERGEQILLSAWEEHLRTDMIAGRVEDTRWSCFENRGLYIFSGDSICHELLSRTLPIQPPYEGEDVPWNESSTQKE